MRQCGVFRSSLFETCVRSVGAHLFSTIGSIEIQESRISQGRQ